MRLSGKHINAAYRPLADLKYNHFICDFINYKTHNNNNNNNNNNYYYYYYYYFYYYFYYYNC